MKRTDSRREDSGLRLLFVCTGNTCRSPLAEVLSRKVAQELGLDHVEIRSAGTHALPGSPASEGARRAARRHGLSLDEHRSSALSQKKVEWADRIFAMGPAHLHEIELLGGEGKGSLLGAFSHEGDEGRRPVGGDMWAIPDPFGGDDQTYEETFRTLERCVEVAMKRLATEGKG